MESIRQKDLRDQLGEVLRRVEAGESLLVTVAGRPVAQLSPAANRKWVSGDSLAAVWRGPAPRDLVDDLGQQGAGVADPCAP